jgi:hypothetical protein
MQFSSAAIFPLRNTGNLIQLHFFPSGTQEIFFSPKIFTNSSQIIFLSFSSPKEALVQIAVAQKINTKVKNKNQIQKQKHLRLLIQQ